VTAVGDTRSDGAAAYDEASALNLEVLLRDFYLWQPIVPKTAPALAKVIAPLTRLLRENYPALMTGEMLPAIASLTEESPPFVPIRYAYRTLDRQFCLPDNRLGDFLRPALWRAQSPRQLFLVSFVTEFLGQGPAATATVHVPDLHFFRGSYGGKHVFPLWRDSGATQPNITAGVLELLQVDPEDLFAYCYALLSAPSYTSHFAGELEIPGPRLPLTRSTALFERVAALRSGARRASRWKRDLRACFGRGARVQHLWSRRHRLVARLPHA
jgi:hypothetical protein